VGEEERQRGGPLAARVEEVDPEPVDVGAEVRERIHRALLRPPVEAPAPVFDQRPEVGQARAVVPAGAVDLVGPERAGQAPLEVVERRLRDVDGERPDVHAAQRRWAGRGQTSGLASTSGRSPRSTRRISAVTWSDAWRFASTVTPATWLEQTTL